METTMNPSKKETTERQINKAVANYRAMLEKHSPEFDGEAVQAVLGQPELAEEQFKLFRKRVEALGGMIVRRVKVNRVRTGQQALDATGRKQYTDRKVVDAMPQGKGEEVEVVFFKVGRYVSDADLEKEYELRGLNPADPYSLAAVNEADNAFADEKPNGTHWKDAEGKWCFATFNLWRVERRVNVRRNFGLVWSVGWWFAGLRK